MPEVLQKETAWSDVIYEPVCDVVQRFKAQGWRVVSLRPGELSEIVMRRKTMILTLVAQDNIVGTVHVFDTTNH
jgi:hypothetical protein